MDVASAVGVSPRSIRPGSLARQLPAVCRPYAVARCHTFRLHQHAAQVHYTAALRAWARGQIAPLGRARQDERSALEIIGGSREPSCRLGRAQKTALMIGT